MPANFLHGVETIDIKSGTRQVRTIKSAVIGLVGTAPTYLLEEGKRSVHKPLLILGDKDAAVNCGSRVPGFTMPAALDAVFKKGAGVVVAVNVFDEAKHKKELSVTATMTGGRLMFSSWADGLVSPKLIISAVLEGYEKGLDYAFDDNGNISALEGGTLSENASVTVNAVVAAPELVTPADIIGAVSAQGIRSGMQALKEAAALYGFSPRILIAPGYCTAGVAAELAVMAENLSGHALIDAPVGASVTDVISGRGTAGSLNLSSSSERVVYCYPHVKVYDTETDTEILEPFSQHLAGVMAAKDLEEGYWISPSNTEILGITGTELNLTASLTDSTSEVNMLNEAGVVTVFSAFGTGYRTWGNRSAAFSSSTHPYNFICVRRMADIVGESIEQATLQFVDGGITNALIDSVRQTVNTFIRSLVMRGALVDGECKYNQDDNTAEEISGGHLVFTYDLSPVIPCERLTFKRYIDISKLANLGV